MFGLFIAAADKSEVNGQIRVTPAIVPKSDSPNANEGCLYFLGAFKFAPTPAIALNFNLQ